MSEAYSPEHPSTPQQAADIFTELGQLTALRGRNYGDSHSFGEVPVEVPDAVAEHMPEPETTSERVEGTIYATQMFDRQTGQPQRTGVVGLVMFNQREYRAEGLIYVMRVNYHVISDGSESYHLERHVTNSEHGPHRVAQHRAEMGRMATREGMESFLADLIGLRDRVQETRPVEQALGLLTVNALEAQQIHATLTELNA